MATYAPVRPAYGAWTAIASVGVDRVAVATGGTVYLSDDASPDISQAIPLNSGQSFFIASGRTIRVSGGGAGAQLRLMDY